MNTDKIDQNKNPSEVLAKDAKTELTEAELNVVVGGRITNVRGNASGVPAGGAGTPGQIIAI